MFYLRLNLYVGIPDKIFIIFTSVVLETISTTFGIMPLLVLYTKITPPHIEATFFASLTGIYNLSNEFVSGLIGALLIRVFGVSTSNLSRAYLLMIA